MNKTSQKVKDWLMSKIPHPEVFTANDDKMMDFMIVFFIETLPEFVGVMFMFSLLSYMYLWGYNKYGFERTIIVMMVNMIIVISMLSKSITKMFH